ncbi:MAG: hypothetical protein ABJL44_13325 [Algibacter sp.]
MYEQADKSKENKSRAVANVVSKKQSNSKSAFQFVDNRLEVVAKKLQEMANSRSVNQLETAQLMLRSDVPAFVPQ